MSPRSLAKPDVYDCAIVGGGVAGPTAAYYLARRGLKTILMEKERGPNTKVCGEFLSSEGLSVLREMGIDVFASGATSIHSFRLHGPYRTFERRLPSPAAGLSRMVLDEILLQRAEKAGVEVRRGTMVRGLLETLEGPSGNIVLEAGDDLIRSRRLVVASGKSEFRSVQNREGLDRGYVGFKTHLKLKPSSARLLKGHCDLFVFKNGYGGLSPVEGGAANFCFLIEKSALKKTGTDWDSLASHIARHNWEASKYLDGAQPLMKQMATIAHIPYGFVRRTRAKSGIYCVGDQMAVIPSLSGDGMSIALRTARAAAQAMIDPMALGQLRPASTSIQYQRMMYSQLRMQIEAGFYLHRLFKNPKVCDWVTLALHAAPGIADLAFEHTRCRVGDPPGARRRVRALRSAEQA